MYISLDGDAIAFVLKSGFSDSLSFGFVTNASHFLDNHIRYTHTHTHTNARAHARNTRTRMHAHTSNY